MSFKVRREVFMKLSTWYIVGVTNCGTRGYLRKEGGKKRARVPGMNPRDLHKLGGENLAKEVEEE